MDMGYSEPNPVYSPTRGLELHLFFLPGDEAILSRPRRCSVSFGLTLASEDGLRERARFLEAAEGARRALPPSPSPYMWSRVFARNMVFCHGNRTSDDARNRVEL